MLKLAPFKDNDLPQKDRERSQPITRADAPVCGVCAISHSMVDFVGAATSKPRNGGVANKFPLISITGLLMLIYWQSTAKHLFFDHHCESKQLLSMKHNHHWWF